MPWEMPLTFDEGGGFTSTLTPGVTATDDPVDTLYFNGTVVTDDMPDPQGFGNISDNNVVVTSYGRNVRRASTGTYTSVPEPIDYATLNPVTPNIVPVEVFTPYVAPPQVATATAVPNLDGQFSDPNSEGFWGNWWNDVNPVERGFFTPGGTSPADVWDIGEAGVSWVEQTAVPWVGDQAQAVGSVIPQVAGAGVSLATIVMMMMMSKER